MEINHRFQTQSNQNEQTTGRFICQCGKDTDTSDHRTRKKHGISIATSRTRNREDVLSAIVIAQGFDGGIFHR
jgi:hypothetical protein